MAGQVETCYNCDTKIGRMEQAYLWQDNVVCEACYHKLSKPTPPEPPPPATYPTPKPRSWFRTGFGITCGVLTAIVAVPVLLFLIGSCLEAMTVYRQTTSRPAQENSAAEPLDNTIEANESLDDTIEADEQSSGMIEVERVWLEEFPNYRCAYALVKYTNDTNRTFRQNITVQATALDVTGTAINTNRRSFFVHEVGLIKPGYSGMLKIPIEVYDQTCDSVTCKIISAQ